MHTCSFERSSPSTVSSSSVFDPITLGFARFRSCSSATSPAPLPPPSQPSPAAAEGPAPATHAARWPALPEPSSPSPPLTSSRSPLTSTSLTLLPERSSSLVLRSFLAAMLAPSPLSPSSAMGPWSTFVADSETAGELKDGSVVSNGSLSFESPLMDSAARLSFLALACIKI